MLRDAPTEVRLATLVGAAGGLLFLLEGALRWQGDGDAAWVRFPLVVLVLELLVVGGLLARLRPARLTAAVVYGLVGLVHLLAVLNQGPVWVRVLSGVLSAGHVFGLVLLNTRPARLHFGAPR
ncbi:hypothetical protein [Saccharothrix algeriensis]|uniref:Uncharacterized protein n=1 Tax=Saccharothrix algeriensis TaxID=173560 RepID=A0A8T8HUC6_9PSEU|nr:hypothetical protein [Saccharothrix algeriensis]MBM7813615.1 hypothetical protein [Saccharothrix algeriensis]QTR02102.1 hypothetical protein J7S33_23175 [Saccharothrix algeriensis]